MDQCYIDEVAAKMKEKGVESPCPRCGKENFVIIGNGRVTIQEGPGFTIGGPGIATVILACDNCGYIMEHAKHSLGLLKGNSK